MLDSLLSRIKDDKARGVAMTAAGMAALLGGQKVAGLGLFVKGALHIEDAWRAAHPEFSGGMDARWQAAVDFYEATHKDDTNRKLHVVGIPLIVGGAAGLLLFRPLRPLWFAAASSFSIGWALNIVGHAVFEKNAPAFADDPLAFLAGPIWDLRQLLGKSGKPRVETVQTAAGPVTVIHVEPAAQA